jgi:hypothetical protein
MSTPEERFEVPPEYAEVYERAYRRAYEEGQGQLSGSAPQTPARRLGPRGWRLAVPEQRSKRAGQRASQRTRQRSGPTRDTPPPLPGKPTERVIPVSAAKAPRNAGHRGMPRGGSTLYPMLGLLGLLALLLVAAFAIGRLSSDTVTHKAAPGPGPAATASATQGTPSATPSPSATPTSSPKPRATVYRGAVAPLRIDKARAGCTAPSGRDARGRPVSYAVRNVLDKDHTTAWRCPGKAIGKRLVLNLPQRARVVEVGLVPGYAKTDPATGRNRYAENNRITKVAWIFDDGTRVVQTMSGSSKNRTLRTMRIKPVRARSVTLKILAVAGGSRNTTMISTVRLGKAA